jgi:3'-phosphoadenosine 5'-phosphosulfate sulfotransferase (PAPS reductase)/FAD synthetase
MKLKNIVLSLALIGTMNVVMADDAAASTTPQSDATQTQINTQSAASSNANVDAQIAKIQAAPAAERVKLMNEFKQQLMQMNQSDRVAAITAMQEKMHANIHNETETHMQATHEHMQEHVQEMQMQVNEHMNQMQNMNQHQAGSQFMHNMAEHGEMHQTPMQHSGAADNMSHMNMKR